MIPALWQLLIGGLAVVGALFALIGAVGLLRFRTFLTRLHAPTKTSTLGLGSILLASMLLAWVEGRPGFAELLITLFVFLTAPISAALLAQAALARRLPSEPPSATLPQPVASSLSDPTVVNNAEAISPAGAEPAATPQVTSALANCANPSRSPPL